jgi:hypothetical protein
MVAGLGCGSACKRGHPLEGPCQLGTLLLDREAGGIRAPISSPLAARFAVRARAGMSGRIRGLRSFRCRHRKKGSRLATGASARCEESERLGSFWVGSVIPMRSSECGMRSGEFFIHRWPQMDTDGQGSGFRVQGSGFVGRTGLWVGFQNITTKAPRAPSRGQASDFRLQATGVGGGRFQPRRARRGRVKTVRCYSSTARSKRAIRSA